MKTHPHGFTLVELIVVLAILGVISTLLVPSAGALLGDTRLRITAGELAGILHRTRALAIRHSTHVAVRFTGRETGAVSFAFYRDGDGDGVLSADIRTGVDPVLQVPRLLDQLGNRVRFGFPPGPPARDPGSPSHLLAPDEDPIRFGTSDMASFDAFGGATPGSLFITDGRSRLAAVRVAGLSGRIRVMFYDFGARVWR